jgi:ubiquinone/menaquinone biosynthesis C-methylase UbiE
MDYEINDHLASQQQKDLGSFYTPKEIALEMAYLLKDVIPSQYDSDFHIIDPCCGKGNLFVAVLETYPQIHNDNLYGIDIDKEAIQFCIDKFPGGHFQYGDILRDDFTDYGFWTKSPMLSFNDIKKKYPRSFFETFNF